MNRKEILGQNIRLLREAKGLNQTELGKVLSVSFRTISAWELGEHAPDIDRIVDIAKFFDVTTDYLLGVDL